jgi:hypothetical protein
MKTNYSASIIKGDLDNTVSSNNVFEDTFSERIEEPHLFNMDYYLLISLHDNLKV